MRTTKEGRDSFVRSMPPRDQRPEGEHPGAAWWVVDLCDDIEDLIAEAQPFARCERCNERIVNCSCVAQREAPAEPEAERLARCPLVVGVSCMESACEIRCQFESPGAAPEQPDTSPSESACDCDLGYCQTCHPVAGPGSEAPEPRGRTGITDGEA